MVETKIEPVLTFFSLCCGFCTAGGAAESRSLGVRGFANELCIFLCVGSYLSDLSVPTLMWRSAGVLQGQAYHL